MKISFHGHRPTWAGRDASAVQDTAARPETQVNPHEEPVRTVHLGFVKIKIHRQTATQAGLMERFRNSAGMAPAQPGSVSTAHVNLIPSAEGGDVPAPGSELPTENPPDTLARRPQSFKEFEAHWNAWAQTGGTTDENRTEAVNRMMVWLNRKDTYAKLDLSNLGLTSLPEHLPEMGIHRVERLDISGNKLISLPNMPTLKFLFASNNQLISLPGGLDSLRYLDARNNQLISLSGMRNLEELDAGDNQIASLFDMRSLWRLDARNNQITSLSSMPNLRHVNVSSNQFTSVPKNIAWLTNPSDYYLRNTTLANGRHVDFRNNPLPQWKIDSLYLTVNDPNYQGTEIDFTMVSLAPASVNQSQTLRNTPSGTDELQLQDLEEIALENISAFLPNNDVIAMSSTDKAIRTAFEPQLSAMKLKHDVSKATSLAELQASMELISELRSAQRPPLLYEAMLRLNILPKEERQAAFDMVRKIDPLTPEPPEFEIIIRYDDEDAAREAGENDASVTMAFDRQLGPTTALDSYKNAKKVAQLFGKTSPSAIYALEESLIRGGEPEREMKDGGNVLEVAKEYGITTPYGIHHLESLTILSRSPNTAGGEMVAGGDLQAVAQKYGITTPDRIQALEDRRRGR